MNITTTITTNVKVMTDEICIRILPLAVQGRIPFLHVKE